MKILIASDSFKGTLSSERIIKLVEAKAGEIIKDCEVKGISVADGGEGTIAAILTAVNGNWEYVEVHDPLMEKINACYGVVNGDTAVIEMAMASGLPLVSIERRNPMCASSYGTGELICDALKRGYRKIVIALGGSATNDGGMGAIRAMGVRFLDKTGNELMGTGADLKNLDRIDISQLNSAVKESEIIVMCDVKNPLTGPSGATFTFGKQKGGTQEVLNQLEAGMLHYAEVIKKQFGVDVDRIEGAGAAGGMGVALSVFLNAQLKSGVETVLDLIDFDQCLDGVDLVITGEGKMDWQSAFGKVVSGVGTRCKKRGIPVIAIVGGMGKGAEKLYDFGIDSIMPTINGAMGMEEAMERAEELYQNAVERTLRMVKVGMIL